MMLKPPRLWVVALLLALFFGFCWLESYQFDDKCPRGQRVVIRIQGGAVSSMSGSFHCEVLP